MIITLKSGPMAGQQQHELQALVKNLIRPGDLSVGGDLTPQQSSKLINMLFEDTFLKQITTVTMMRLTRLIEVMEMQTRLLVRVPQGDEPDNADLNGASEDGSTLTALDAQLFWTLTLNFIREHANKSPADFQKEIEKSFGLSLTADLVDLGFNGVADDATGATRAARFVRLNKGWWQIMREANNTAKVQIDPALNGWVATLKDIKAAADARVRATSTFFMHEADADEYSEEINAPVTGYEVQTQAPARKYKGNMIISHPRIPPGTVAFTPPKNLVFGVHKDIRRDRAYHSRKRALEYTIDKAFDYEVAIKRYAVLGE